MTPESLVARSRRWLPHPLTALSGLLIVVSFPPWDLAPFIWVSLVPWFAALSQAPTRRRAMAEGLWLSFLMSMGGFYWVASVLKEFGGLPWPLAIVGLLGYGLIGQPQFTIFAPILRHATAGPREPSGSAAGRTLLLAIALGLAYTGIDAFLPKLFVDTLGHSLYSAPWLRQVADLGGAPLLTFLIYFVNDTIWRILRRLAHRSEPSVWPSFHAWLPQAALALGLVVAGLAYGRARLAQVEMAMQNAPRKIQMAAIQANIGDFEKVAAERGVRGAADKVLDTYFSLSDQALGLTPRPDVLIWPETSYPSTFRTPHWVLDSARDRRVERFVRERGIPLLFGGYDRTLDRENPRDFNAFFFLSPRGSSDAPGEKDLQIYRKHILLLFGEYIPGADSFLWIKRMFPQVGNFGRGDGPSAIRVPLSTDRPPVFAGPAICYEALFSDYVIESARKGADLILNITNDSWFGPYGEPQLHLALTTFRSVETRLPVLRATNTGISALILPDGSISEPTPLNEPRILNVSVPLLAPIPTLLKAWGDWFGRLGGVLGFLLLFGLAWRPGALESPSKK